MEFTQHKPLQVELSETRPVKDNSHLEKFAHQMFSELCKQFPNDERLEVFGLFRAMVKEENENQIRELNFSIDRQKGLAESLNSFIF